MKYRNYENPEELNDYEPSDAELERIERELGY